MQVLAFGVAERHRMIRAGAEALQDLHVAVRIGRRTAAGVDSNRVALLLAVLAQRAACDVLAVRGIESIVLERARDLEREVQLAAVVRFPERPLLARDLALAAFVDTVWRAASIERPNPVTSLRALWMTGYVLSAIDSSGVTLELPPLES